jgi:hypothetical protein
VLYEEDIQPIRKQLHYDDYMASFEALKRFAESYKKTNVNQIHISKDVIIYPIITRTKPHRETTGVDLNSEIQIVFDEDMDENTINEQNIIVTEYESEKKVDGKLIWDSKNRTAVFKPSRCFGRGVAYNVTIKNEVRDKTGTQLKENDSWWFMTHNQP